MSNWFERIIIVFTCLIVLGLIIFMVNGCFNEMNRTKPLIIENAEDIEEKDITIIKLSPGDKLQTVNWERTHDFRYLYVLTRPMHKDEIPEVYKYYKVDSNKRYEIHETK